MAHRLAKVERESDICSTCYILTTCPTYNVPDPANRNLLRELNDWGFEIGLHFDPTLYEDDAKTDAADR